MRWTLFFLVGVVSAQGTRYWDSLFYVRKQTLVYGSAPTINHSNLILEADAYLPDNDTVTQRPVVIFLHGGAFAFGSRGDADMAYLARYFAQRGYVAFSLSYRLGLSEQTARGWIEALFRATQDLRGFIRFLKSTFAQGNPYGIDTTRIYAGGSSAGAIAAIHAAYVDRFTTWAQVPQADTLRMQQWGTIEGSSGIPGYSSAFHGVFSLSGGILRSNWIQKPIPIVCMHGDADYVVPYKYGNLPLINLYCEGGFAMDSAAASKGYYHGLFTWRGGGHAPYGGFQGIFYPYIEDAATFLRYHLYQWVVGNSASLGAAEKNPLWRQGEEVFFPSTWQGKPYRLYDGLGRLIGQGVLSERLVVPGGFHYVCVEGRWWRLP
ncbi:MAG: alpha/beta hydrolase [Bacteroidia bacterium]